MQRYISPIGFSPHLVTRPIIAAGVSAGDRVKILRPTQPDTASEERAQNAVDDVRSTLAGVVSNVTITIEEIGFEDFATTVKRCSEIVTDGEPPVVCLGAGATDLHVPLTIATITHADHVARTMLYSDLGQTTEEITMPALTTDLPGRTRETFRALNTADASEVSLSDLTALTDVDRTTISRHVTSLEQRGFVETRLEQKEKMVSLTLLGELTARNATLVD